MRVVLDTPRSQTVDANPAGLSTLERRAALLADLRLAAAAAGALREESLAPITSDVQEFVAEKVGPPRAKEVVNRPRRMIAVAVAGSVFGLLCACITLISGLSHARRRPGYAASFT